MRELSKFDLSYFQKGPYKGARTDGLSKYLGKYYWARRFYAKLIKKMTQKGGAILEIGCGFGDLLAFLEGDYKTYGTDISKDAIGEAKKRLKKTRLFIQDVKELDKFKKGSFDTIVAMHILEHLENPEKTISIISQILRKGGFAFVVMPNPDSLGHRLKGEKWVGFRDKTHISLYTPDKWLSLFKKNSFEIKKTFGDGLWDSPYIPLVPTTIQKLFFGLTAMAQVTAAYPFIPQSLGESIVIIAQRKS